MSSSHAADRRLLAAGSDWTSCSSSPSLVDSVAADTGSRSSAADECLVSSIAIWQSLHDGHQAGKPPPAAVHHNRRRCVLYASPLGVREEATNAMPGDGHDRGGGHGGTDGGGV